MLACPAPVPLLLAAFTGWGMVLLAHVHERKGISWFLGGFGPMRLARRDAPGFARYHIFTRAIYKLSVSQSVN